MCDHEVLLVMSPVMQPTGWRIVDTWVQLHLMLTFAYSGEPHPTHCSTEFTTAGLWTSLKCRVVLVPTKLRIVLTWCVALPVVVPHVACVTYTSHQISGTSDRAKMAMLRWWLHRQIRYTDMIGCLWFSRPKRQSSSRFTT